MNLAAWHVKYETYIEHSRNERMMRDKKSINTLE